MIGLAIVGIIVAIIGWKIYERKQILNGWESTPGFQIHVPTGKITVGAVQYIGDRESADDCLNSVAYSPQYKTYTYYDDTDLIVPNACFAGTAQGVPSLVAGATANSGYRTAKKENYDNKAQLKMMRMGGAANSPSRDNKSDTNKFFANNTAGTFDAEGFYARQTTVGTEWEGRY